MFFLTKKNKWGQAACATNSSYAKNYLQSSDAGTAPTVESLSSVRSQRCGTAACVWAGRKYSTFDHLSEKGAEYNIKKNICIHYILCVSIHAQAKQ